MLQNIYNTFKFVQLRCIFPVLDYWSNRGIKTQRTMKAKYPLQFYINCLTILIGQLGLVWMVKKICKQTRQQTINYYQQLSANQFVYMLSSCLPIGQPKKTYLTNHNCETIYAKLEGKFGLNGPLCFITLLLELVHFSILLHFLDLEKLISLQINKS